MQNQIVQPTQHVGNSCVPDWCTFDQIYPRAIVGEPAPYFEATAFHNFEFKKVSLEDYKGKYVVLFFYPLDFTFVCPTEICAFADANKDFEESNCALIGASIDSEFAHFEYCSKARKKGGLGEIPIPLLADVTKTISRIYGALVTKGPNSGVTTRATFIIDGKGVLRHASYNDLPVGRNVDEVLRLVQAFQYVDEHGEVCPSKWKKGDKNTLKTDVKANEEYWKNQHGGH